MSLKIGECDVLFASGEDTPPRSSAVTVAISLYNYEAFIEDCLASVSAQTHVAIELVVVDDASTRDASADRCRAWLQREAARFDRALLLRHRQNRGLATARNTGFEAARTDYVFVLDADNTLYPRAIERLWSAASAVEADVAYSQLEFHGDQAGVGYADIWNSRRIRFGNYVDAMALVSRACWRDVGSYSHLEGGWEDFDFWCKLMELGAFALFVPEILCRYRVHATSMLRTYTAASSERLKVEMTIRHPWLELV